MKSSYTIRKTAKGATISAKGAAAQALFNMLTNPKTPEQKKLADMVVRTDAPEAPASSSGLTDAQVE